MSLIRKVRVRNFKCYRRETEIALAQATYVVGGNNSGKSAILKGLHCFFDSAQFSPEFLNETERASRREGSNRSDILVEFDLSLVAGKLRRKRLVDEFGSSIEITKSFIYREISRTVAVEYALNRGKRQTYELLDRDVQALLSSVRVSYIHPQEGSELLARAQEKFKQRLFHNWGRHASVASVLKRTQKDWNVLRHTASQYLSAALTENIRKIWPGSETKVDLPAKIEEIVAVSDITFKGAPALPEVTLTSQGTGAQSTILYQTHFILDSDRTLHQGMYFPVWLLEEPESFLHADIAVQLGRLLSSPEWLKNIQMIISTHSPIILAASHQAKDLGRWAVLTSHEKRTEKPINDVTVEDIKEIGKLMGDSNFDAYFAAASPGTLIFCEDSRLSTIELLRREGIDVTRGLKGITEIKKYLNVFLGSQILLKAPTCFLVDCDSGRDEIADLLSKEKRIKTRQGFKLFELVSNLFVITLPDGEAIEDLCVSFVDFVANVRKEICDEQLHLKQQIPKQLTRAAAQMRGKTFQTEQALITFLKKTDDVKDAYWAQSGSEHLIKRKKIALKELVRGLLGH